MKLKLTDGEAKTLARIIGQNEGRRVSDADLMSPEIFAVHDKLLDKIDKHCEPFGHLDR